MKVLTWVCGFLALQRAAAAATCERLQQSVTYTQEKAPRDLSDVVSADQADLYAYTIFITHT